MAMNWTKARELHNKCEVTLRPYKEEVLPNTPTVTTPGRIDKTGYYLEIAKAVALRSTCIRRQYGAVIVKDDRIIATGYNGSARGEVNCCDTGTCWRDIHNIPHGEQYEKCLAVHAEDNAISQAGREAIGATLYLAGFENGRVIDAKPCLMCERKIRNAGIVYVVGTEALGRWRDNADSYICSVCGFETCNPNKNPDGPGICPGCKSKMGR